MQTHGNRRSVACWELPSWTESRPEEPTLSSSAVFAISGVALLVLGLMVARAAFNPRPCCKREARTHIAGVDD
jgi:hypothetical protein